MLTDQNNSATIELKGSVNGEAQRIGCVFGGVKGKRLTLEVPQRIAASTTLSVEYNDALFLGEVVACTEDCANKWHLEINIEQILTGLQSLVTLRSRLLGDSVPALGIRPAMAAR